MKWYSVRNAENKRLGDFDALLEAEEFAQGLEDDWRIIAVTVESVDGSPFARVTSQSVRGVATLPE